MQTLIHINDNTIITTLENAVTNKADKSELPTKLSDLTNDEGFLKKVILTKAEYDALDEIDDNILYVISDGSEVGDNNFITESQLDSRGFLVQSDKTELIEANEALSAQIGQLQNRITELEQIIAQLQSEMANTLTI